MRVLCVALPSMLPQARVLRRSLQVQHPDWAFQLALLGRPHNGAVVEAELGMVSVEEELGLDIGAILARNPPREVIWQVLPLLLQRRCAADDGPWLHLPAGTWVLDDLSPIAAQLRERGGLFVPRDVADPPDDGLEPTPQQLRSVGRLAPDLIGVDGSAAAVGFLDWWRERIEDIVGPLGERVGSRNADEIGWLLRTLELAPARFSAATVDDPGSAVSVWNLHHRTITERDGRLWVNETAPLRFMDLTGFDPDRPFRLTANSSRVHVSRSPALRELCRRYAGELGQAGWREQSGRVAVGGRLANGVAFDETMASLYAAATELGQDFGDLSSVEGAQRFTAWLTEPIAPWNDGELNRYVVHRVTRERSDVTATFPNLYAGDSERFAAWWQRSGRHEMPLDQALAPAPTARPTTPLSSRRLPKLAAGTLLRPRPVRRAMPAPDGQLVGVRVTGYLSHILGLGSAARGYASALAAAGVPLSTMSVDLDHLNAAVELSPEYGRHSHADVAGEGGHAFELLCINADELPYVIESLGEDHFRGPRIGVWGWETNRIPERWEKSFRLLDEIWVYSRFMADNIGAVAPVPVVALPPPVSAPARQRAPMRLGVPDGFLFLFMFDYLSTIQRKNPIGLVEAFKRAFAPNEGPQLLLKTINAPLRPLAEEELLWAVDGRPDIHVVDRSLSGEEKDAVMMACDCYVSLHRSEGFGLTLAEAMVIGKPVIGTAYSGNLDFMNPENSYLVDYEITRVGPDCEIYPADGEWAEPDVEGAAALMRRVVEQPAEAARLGARAREDVLRRLSPEAAGAAMRRRLEELAVSG